MDSTTQEKDGSEAKPSVMTLPDILHFSAVTTLMERGRRTSMEDAFAVGKMNIKMKTTKKDARDAVDLMVAVFDGHGGDECAHYCRDELFHSISTCKEFPSSAEKAIQKSFESTDKTLNKLGKKYKNSGTTATVGIFRIPIDKASSSSSASSSLSQSEVNEANTVKASPSSQKSTQPASEAATFADDEIEFFIGHVGDSRAVLVKSTKEVIELSQDHKGDRKDEQQRIKSLGGTVSFDKDDNIYRVMGVLAVTRAIGDFSLKPFVTAKPETNGIRLKKGEDKFILIASDGLWDTVKNEDVASILLDKGRKNGAKELCDMALTRGSDDNVCFVIVSIDELFEGPNETTFLNDIPNITAITESQLSSESLEEGRTTRAGRKRGKANVDVSIARSNSESSAGNKTESEIPTQSEELDESQSSNKTEKKRRTKR